MNLIQAAPTRLARLEYVQVAECGYTHVRNAAAKNGVWKVGGRGVPIYARHDLSEAERQRVAVALTIAESAPRRPILRAVE